MSTDQVTATAAGPGDRAAAVATTVAAFARDPAVRFMFPDDDTYPAHAAAFFGHLFDRRVGHGAVWIAGDGHSVALWEPPADAAAGPESLDFLPVEARRRVREYNRAVHPAIPAEPHWYLGVLATHPDHTGRGYGRAAMAAGLRRAHADGVPAYLETSNPRNVDLYRRAGWEVATFVENTPPIWVMRHDRYAAAAPMD